jgi:hypothetical protein
MHRLYSDKGDHPVDNVIKQGDAATLAFRNVN